MMTDELANVVWQAKYLPYGEVYSITGPASLDYRFPGQWFQLESGLAYNWHRHYDATTGRYVQPDPLGMPDGPSRWAYAANNPLMNVDPDGQLYINSGGQLVITCDDVLLFSGPLGAYLASCFSPPPPPPPPPSSPKDEPNWCDPCEEQLNGDLLQCKTLAAGRAGGSPAGKIWFKRCEVIAYDRYSACRAGKPIPPFPIWDL